MSACDLKRAQTSQRKGTRATRARAIRSRWRATTLTTSANPPATGAAPFVILSVAKDLSYIGRGLFERTTTWDWNDGEHTHSAPDGLPRSASPTRWTRGPSLALRMTRGRA